MREQVHPFQAKVLAQGVDVVDEPVAAVRRCVVRYRGPAGAPEIQRDQLPVRGKAAEVAEIHGGLHRPGGLCPDPVSGASAAAARAALSRARSQRTGRCSSRAEPSSVLLWRRRVDLVATAQDDKV
jgi:hypothetical protein